MFVYFKSQLLNQKCQKVDQALKRCRL